MGFTQRASSSLEAVQARHRLIVTTGTGFLLVGIVIATYVGYEWIVARRSHEVLAIVAGSVTLLGIQLLVFSALSSMLVTLHLEHPTVSIQNKEE